MSSAAFTIYHLPYGVVTVGDSSEPFLATAFGDYAINLNTLVKQGFFKSISNGSSIEQALMSSTWNAFASLDPITRSSYRSQLKNWLQPLGDRTTTTIPIPDQYQSAWIPLSSTTLHFPMQTFNYSDFYCSHEHAKNCSAVFGFPISPSWFTLPQVYNGRTSSLAVTGTPITRPVGIFPLNPGDPVTFQAESKLDFELEMGVFISRPVARGTRLAIAEAKSHIFGLALLNDWSARRIQFHEIQPLGPFHSKGSLTSVAGWITPIEAVDAVAQSARHTPQDPAPLPHLTYPHAASATWNVHVSATLVRDGREFALSTSNLNELHWTPLQMVAYLASAGEGLQTGDLFGTGTLSSARTDARGEKVGLSCLWERQVKGMHLSSLPEGIAERLLEDGDEIVLRGWCEGNDGQVLFQMGECRGKVLPAVALTSAET